LKEQNAIMRYSKSLDILQQEVYKTVYSDRDCYINDTVIPPLELLWRIYITIHILRGEPPTAKAVGFL